ncbi:hypothetical protein, partial [Streptomyces calidiresistens]|uniref:hypothetical protein n=1 Tax=Streptomyces calidiresistens TaxID=1485586 RepID=UPI0015FBF1B5
AGAGGTALVTSRDPMEAVRIADRVISVANGRLVADQTVEDFARTRLRPRVAVRTPHAERLAALLRREFRASGVPVPSSTGAPAPLAVGVAAAGSSAPAAGPGPSTGGASPAVQAVPEVVLESGGRLSVYGAGCAEVGEIAHRHRLVLHELTREIGTTGDRRGPAPAGRADGRAAPRSDRDRPERGVPEPRGARGRGAARRAPLPAAPARPLRYEVLRWCGSRAMTTVALAGVLLTLVLAGILAHGGHEGATTHPRVLLGWAPMLPVPVSALVAGALGAAAVGQELRRPGLLPRVGGVRRCAPLSATIVVSTAVALAMSASAALPGAVVFPLLAGTVDGVTAAAAEAFVPALRAVVEGAGPAVGCAVLGPVLAAVFRSGVVGISGVLLLPPAVAALAPRITAVSSASGADVPRTERIADLVVALPFSGADLPGTPAAWFPAFAEILARVPGAGSVGWWPVSVLLLPVSLLLLRRVGTSVRRRRWEAPGPVAHGGRVTVPRAYGDHRDPGGDPGGRRGSGETPWAEPGERGERGERAEMGKEGEGAGGISGAGRSPGHVPVGGAPRGWTPGAETVGQGAESSAHAPPEEMSGLR